MYKELLPLGSVVDVKESEESLLICGRVMARANDEKVYDYVGVSYPVGLSDPTEMLFFNDEDIDNIDFIGCKNAVEKEFVDTQLAPLDDAKSVRVVNGKIVVETSYEKSSLN